MKLTPDVFTGASNHADGGVQAAVMAELEKFLETVPAGETVEVLPATSKALNQLCSASGNVVAQRVATFNQQVVADPVLT